MIPVFSLTSTTAGVIRHLPLGATYTTLVQ